MGNCQNMFFVWKICLLCSVGLSLPVTQDDMNSNNIFQMDGGIELRRKDTMGSYGIIDEEGLLSYDGATRDDPKPYVVNKNSKVDHLRQLVVPLDVGHGDTTSQESGVMQMCVPVSITMCHSLDLYPLSQYPNALGHVNEGQAIDALKGVSPLATDPACGPAFRVFACLLYAPQCSGTGDALLPCRPVCQRTRDVCLKVIGSLGLKWPVEWRCDRFPKEGLCLDQDSQITPVPEPLTNMNAQQSSLQHSERSVQHSLPMSQRPDARATPQRQLDPQSTNSRQIALQPANQRRYNLAQLGQSDLFQGWADVQGAGSANDYCRVIGSNPSLRFLSCSLAGSDQQNHHYVSLRGFDVGHRHTWFMRDMDGDGRDDYCRCVGRGIRSHVSCMKAGERGFYGSPQQAGSEYTFKLQIGGPCFQKTFNPFLGVEHGRNT